MSITAFAPSATDVAGKVYVGAGAGFASVTGPKLSEISMNLTAGIVGGFGGTTDVTMKEFQLYSEATSSETVDKVTRKLDSLTVYSDGSNDSAFLTLFAEGNSVGLFLRPFTASGTALAAAQKGDAYNAKVASVARGSAQIGDKWTYVVTFSEITRSALNVALAS